VTHPLKIADSRHVSRGLSAIAELLVLFWSRAVDYAGYSGTSQFLSARKYSVSID